MIKKISKFFNEVKFELKKVSWSSRDDLISSTLVVLTSVFLLALFIGICDFMFSKFIALIIK